MTWSSVEAKALAQLQKLKAALRSHLKRNYEHAAQDCRTCPAAGSCCNDSHFVNVNITRLEAVAIKETLERTPRLSSSDRDAVYQRARTAVEDYQLRLEINGFKQTFSCPLYDRSAGCLVHRRAKPAACIQHGCYARWEDVPPVELQWRTEHHVERLNQKAYGKAWAWLPLPVWLVLIDPQTPSGELHRLISTWANRTGKQRSGTVRRSLPVYNRGKIT